MKKQSEGDEAEPEGEKRDELQKGNSPGVPKSTVPVGKLKQKERDVFVCVFSVLISSACLLKLASWDEICCASLSVPGSDPAES